MKLQRKILQSVFALLWLAASTLCVFSCASAVEAGKCSSCPSQSAKPQEKAPLGKHGKCCYAFLKSVEKQDHTGIAGPDLCALLPFDGANRLLVESNSLSPYSNYLSPPPIIEQIASGAAALAPPSA